MSIPNYRVLVSYDNSQNVFRARSPELEHCFGEAATRAEAISKLEQEIQAQLQNMKEQNKQPPKAVDDQDWNGEITTHVSKLLHRDLAWQARVEGIELAQLLSEILAGGLENRRQAGRSTRPHSRNQNEGNHAQSGNRPDRESGERGHRNHGSNYATMFDDRANFIQYVRGIESEHGREGVARGKDKPRGPHKHHHNNKRRHNGGGRRPAQGAGEQTPHAASASGTTAGADVATNVVSTQASSGNTSSES